MSYVILFIRNKGISSRMRTYSLIIISLTIILSTAFNQLIIPWKVYKKAVKKGFEFTLMVVGESGLGKVNINQMSNRSINQLICQKLILSYPIQSTNLKKESSTFLRVNISSKN